jgi:hypothetical protein
VNRGWWPREVDDEIGIWLKPYTLQAANNGAEISGGQAGDLVVDSTFARTNLCQAHEDVIVTSEGRPARRGDSSAVHRSGSTASTISASGGGSNASERGRPIALLR